jgi:proteasome accessory factor A
VDRLVQDVEITRAEQLPPTDTRAYFRGHCVKKYAREVYGASWTSVLFDVGNTTIKRIPLMEPLRGSEALTRELLDASNSAADLLGRLTA